MDSAHRINIFLSFGYFSSQCTYMHAADKFDETHRRGRVSLNHPTSLPRVNVLDLYRSWNERKRCVMIRPCAGSRVVRVALCLSTRHWKFYRMNYSRGWTRENGTEGRSRVEFQGQPTRGACVGTALFPPHFDDSRLSQNSITSRRELLPVYNYQSFDVASPFLSPPISSPLHKFDSEVPKKLHFVAGCRMLFRLAVLVRDNDINSENSLQLIFLK